MISINVGDTITWTNADTVGHTATSGKSTDAQYGTIWDSSLIKAGGSFISPAFTTAGTYNYFCMVHPWMTGEIIVGQGGQSNLPPTTKIPPPTSIITVSTDKSSYNFGDIITISGTASNYIVEAPVTVIVRNPIGNIVMVHQVILGTDRTYSTTVTANTGVWQSAGTYAVYVQLGGSGTSATTAFQFAGSSGASSGPSTIPVDGTNYSVSYSITNGVVLDMKANPTYDELTATVQVSSGGSLEITIPRALLDSRQNNNEIPFIAIVDGTLANIQEMTPTATARTISIGLSPGNKQIEIIGTYLVGSQNSQSPTSPTSNTNAITSGQVTSGNMLQQQIVTTRGIFYVEGMTEQTISGNAKIISIPLIYKNTQNKQDQIYSFYFNLNDSKDNSHTPETESTWPDIQVLPNDMIRGELKFVMGTDVEPTVLTYDEFEFNVYFDVTKTLSPPDQKPKSDLSSANGELSNGELQLKVTNEYLSGNNPMIYNVSVELDNISDQSVSVFPQEFYAKDQDGNVYSIDWDSSVFTSGEIYPGASAHGDLKFQMTGYVPTQVMLIYDKGYGSPTINTGFHNVTVEQQSLTQQPASTNLIQNTTQYSPPQTTTSIPEINQSSSSQIPMKTYQNNEYNFTIQYPSDWLVEENYVSANGNIGVVQFESDATEAASLSVWGKVENIQQLGGNQYLNKMVQDAQNFCNKNNCTFQLEKSEIIPTNGLTHYIITGTQYWVTTVSNSTIATAQFYIEDDIFNGNDIWKLYGYATVTNSSDIPKATAYYDEMVKSLISFTIRGTNQPSPISSSITTSTNQSTVLIPSWIHNTAKWWAEGSVGDNDFVKGIQYLIQQKIITIPNTTQSNTQSTNQIPPWVKGIAGWWADGKISDNEFIRGIQFLVQAGIIKV